MPAGEGADSASDVGTLDPYHVFHPADALLAPGEPGLARGSVLHRRAEERSRLDE